MNKIASPDTPPEESEQKTDDSAGPLGVGRLRRLKLLARFAGRYKALIILASINLVIAASATLGIFKSLELIVDRGFAADDPGAIDRYFLLLLGVVVALAVSTMLRFYFVTLLGERVVADIRRTVHAHVIALQPSFFEENRPSEIVARLTNDTTVIQMVVGSSFSIALRNLLMFLGGIVLLLMISPKLLGLIALVVPIVIGPIVYIGRKVRLLSRHSQDRIADVGSMANEAFSAIQVVQAYTQEPSERSRFREAVDSALHTAKQRIQVRSWLTGLVILLVFGAIDLVLWQGAKDVIAGRMTGGELASFVGLSIVVAGAVGALSEVYGELQRAAGASARIQEILKTEPEIKAPANPVSFPGKVEGRIRFDDVTFAYPSKPKINALDHVSFEVTQGESLALVGPSGAGKSTVLQLLLRFFDPKSGRIYLDDIDISTTDPRDLRSHMAVVPQDTVVFADSVLENIRYGRPEASDQEVRSAAEMAAADEFIDELADGYDTYLGERGARLSGGQRQRIAIARAILRNAPILLLDEATSALDAESERLVQLALERLMRNRTTIVIAHRLATVQAADRIAVFDRGHIIATGSHQELLQRNKLYARLAELQFKL